MKVVFRTPFLDFFLLVTHVYASASENGEPTGTATTSIPDAGSTDKDILKTTATPPKMTTTDPCPTSALKPPVITSYTNSSISITHPTISWALDYEKCGENIILVVNCTNTKNETDVRTKNIPVHANETEVSSELDSLEELAMYRCHGTLRTNTSLESNSSEPIIVSNIITGKIIIVNISSTARSIFIKWDALPSKSKLNYLVHITEEKPGHFAPDCGKRKSMINESTKQTVYTFEDASPDYSYSIVISTIIRNNRISSDVNTTTTSAAAPEKPRKVVVQNSTTDDLSANISKLLSWDMPCNPNGRIQRFDIELTGVYTPDRSHIPVMKFNYKLEKPNEEHFDKTLEGLTAATDYTLNIKAIGANGEAGIGYETSFKTRDAIPYAPEVYIASQNSSYLDIHWNLPDGVRFGKITTYNLSILPSKPAYGEYPSNCPAQDPFYVPLDGAFTSYNYPYARSYWIYDIIVSASTSLGTGLNGTVHAITNTSAPEKPRNVVVQNLTTDDLSAKISKVLSWDMPCNPNGQIQRFDIELTGVYTPDRSHNPVMKFNYTLEKPNEEHFDKTLEGLTAATDYTLNIKAIGANGEAGIGYETSFRTRDAIPSAPHVNIASQSSSYLEIHWKFPNGEVFGKITSYNLNIIPVKPANGPYPSTCDAQQPFYRLLEDGDTTSFNYTPAHSDWIYDIYVNASTSLGTGQNGTLQATTNTSSPGMPRNFDLSIPEIDDGSTNIKKIISWDVPCYPNDRIISYRVNVNGYYIPDGSHTYTSALVFPVSTDQEHYNQTLEQLNASTKYVLNITAIGGNGEGTAVNDTFTTKDAIPDAPVIPRNYFTISNSSVTVVWDSPTKKAGKIIHYEIKVTPLSPLYSIPEDCTDNRRKPLNMTVNTNTYSFDVLPSYRYEVGVAAATTKGLGEFALAFFNTNVGVPEKVRFLNFTQTPVTQEDYDASAIITFKLPCITNGILKNIKVQYTGTRTNFSGIFHEDYIDFSEKLDLEYKFDLKPEYSYQIGVTAENEQFNNTYHYSFNASSGVPLMDSRHPIEISRIGLNGADVTLRKEQLDNSNGDIKYISLILSEFAPNVDGKFGAWDGHTWPVVFHEKEYQLTPDFWNPFKVDDVVTFEIGKDSRGCSKSLKYCNEPLEENKQFFLIVRLLTKDFYKDTSAIPFTTGKSWTSFILGLIFGLLIAGIIGLIAYILWKKGVFQMIASRIPRRNETKPESTRIPCKKFLQYCKNMECNPQKYQEQYTLLTEKAKEVTADKTISIATLSENRRKNRYTNIAPYDETRVELRIDEDDEIASDYINASFIKGYSGYIEYIATQGPMVTTTRDFWKMVLQENVTLIVMVSQFVENDKQKCHRYFPKNHESMTISDDMEVRCSTELHFGTYCVRNLQIRKDEVQATVTHMQFLDWPDFGVPSGTDHVLQFCYQLRERIRMDGGLMIVHCSAGVGRTGTLIATDILLQSAHAGKHLDVYNTVLELRRQRVMMVQTDKQYVFIHSMLKDHLDRPPSPDLMEHSEPVYENMEIIQDSRNCENDTNRNEDESNF